MSGRSQKMSDYYTADRPDSLSAETPEDAVKEFISCFCPDEEIPPTVMVQGYNRVKISPNNAIFKWNLDRLYEELDEEFDPEGVFDNRTESKEEIEAAYAQFVETVISTYKVWACDPDGEPFEMPVVLDE